MGYLLAMSQDSDEEVARQLQILFPSKTKSEIEAAMRMVTQAIDDTLDDQ
jgi:hypothetical protein